MRQILAVVLALSCLFGLVLTPTTADAAQPFTYVSPAAGARHVSPTTSLAFRQGSPFAASDVSAAYFSVAGSRSGTHSGTVTLSDDGLTIVYYPDRPFAYDETVYVQIRPGIVTAGGIPIASGSLSFATLQRRVAATAGQGDSEEYGLAAAAEAGPGLSATPYLTYPEFTSVMTRTVTVAAQGTGDGYVFVAGIASMNGFDPALFILDNAGEPIYIQRTPNALLTSDFKRQVVNGIPYLTYYVGQPTMNWSDGTYYVLDQSYTVVDTWAMGNGYGADLHELQLLDNGHALLLSYTPIPVDLRPYGGPEDGAVVDLIIQEQDAAKDVVFEWHASQHIPFTDSYIGLSQSPVDYIHGNAIEVDNDGQLLISSRHLSEITKINRQTGAIIWRLGGKQNQFTFTNDGGFSFQHDIRRLANGHITLFDNGNQHTPPLSRAVEYAINEQTKTVTRVWQFADGGAFAPFMANAQRLENGNTMIGWGSNSLATEVRPDGVKAFELAHGAMSYRAFRYTWNATPSEQPRLVLRYGSDATAATIYAAWNGATGVSGYEVYAGPTADAMTLVTTTPRSGFETTATIGGLDTATCVFTVRPVLQGVSTPFSNNVYRLDQPHCREQLHIFYFPAVGG